MIMRPPLTVRFLGVLSDKHISFQTASNNSGSMLRRFSRYGANRTFLKTEGVTIPTGVSFC